MKKILLRIISVFIVLLFCVSPVFALTIDTGNTQTNKPTDSKNEEQSSNKVVNSVTTLELVEKKLCEINLTKPGSNDVIGKFTKELTNFDASKKEATLTLTIKNIMEKETITKPVEVLLVLDNSDSMNKTYMNKTKKEYVTETAKLFADTLFENFKDAKMGVVSFSSLDPVDNDVVVDDTIKLGTINDANLLLSLSNSKEDIQNAINKAYIEKSGPYTNIEAGLELAQSNFSNRTDAEKYVILISDGVPNLSLDADSSTQQLYSGTTASRTKAKLQAMEKAGYHIFSVLMGFNQANTEVDAMYIANSTTNKTYRTLAQEVFGTVDNPTAGEFFYIDYNNLDVTINTNIYDDIAKVENTNPLTDVVIKDYFPKEIIDNFNFEYVKSPNIGEVSQKVNTSDNSITWNIKLLNAGEVATLSYKLTLKDDYDKAIVDKIIPTNTKVDIDYNYNNQKKDADSTVSPTVRVKYSESSKDDTTAKKPIPQTGMYTVLFIISILGIVTFAIIKASQIKKLK